ncbi:DUF3137 domain-containing protein [Rhizobium sp. TRM95111]|uniref:DUF3137 domain-containing protein n=1 Tax=Rhizobium alarense TaxID=2846851 RepID=UPI001F3492FB|nr:DUF3137 domain-containing protein [Rhizobium alarense]MCF3639876.1 DUF3137 domain-containing protein [Rhizobium alarense]
MAERIDEAALMPDGAALEKIRTALEAYNRERPAVAADMWRRRLGYMAGFAVLVAAVLYGVWKAGDPDVFGFALGGTLVCGFFVWSKAHEPARDFQQGLRHRLMPSIFGFVEGVRYSNGETPRFIAAMPGKEFVSRDRSAHDDTIAGRHEGLDFTLTETELTSGSGKHKTTHFKGIIFHFRRDERFAGLLVATKRPNAFALMVRNFFSAGNLQSVTSGHPDVDESHEFRTDNPTAATPIVQGTLARGLDFLSGLWRDDTIRIALHNHECYLLVPTKTNYFELPSVETDVDFDRHVRPMIRDLMTLLATAQLVRKIG